MKKISIALVSMLMAGQAAAVDVALSAANTKGTAPATNAAQTVTVTTASALFIVNPFNFTVSAGVAIGAMQDAANFGVSAGAVKGRTVYTGHSNGGSVSQCGAQTVAGATATPNTLVTDRLDLTQLDSCAGKGDIVAAPAS
jgi:hypothetical protein